MWRGGSSFRGAQREMQLCPRTQSLVVASAHSGCASLCSRAWRMHAAAEWGRACFLQHIALTVNEELDLHHRLLEDLDEDVEVTHSRMRAAQKKLKHVMRRAGKCRSMCFMIALMVILAVVIIIVFKLASLFH